MKYLSREIRNEIADVLIVEHNGWVRYRDKQQPHPTKGIHIKRGVAENKIKRLRELIALVAPQKLREKAVGEAGESAPDRNRKSPNVRVSDSPEETL